jgi:hypothetical protein
MTRNGLTSPALRTRQARTPLVVTALLAVALSCNENLPSGPNNFAATLQIVAPHDTLVVGDSSAVQARVTDASGHVIQSLSFTWSSADSSILGFAAPGTPDASAGRSATLVGRRSGRSALTVSLPDPRFVTPSSSRTETVVVGGVRVLSTHDSILTAVNDTGFAIGAGLVRSNGALVLRSSQGLRWTHLGTHTTVVGQGDTIRYIARSNGVDTLIASHDFCLATAKCADTVVIHITQQLSLSLSTHELLAWSFRDTLGPVVTIADRRGTGLAGTFVRLIPLTPADSALVKVSAPLGTSNTATGVVAAPRLISVGNGTARVALNALAPDGSLIASDTITVTIRQVAGLVGFEPFRAMMTVIDSIPIEPVVRDARGAVIADATIAVSAVGVPLHGQWAGPKPANSAAGQGTITPTVTGISLPDSNPLAPQIGVTTIPAVITIPVLDSVKAGATAHVISVTVLDSNGVSATGSWIRFESTGGVVPDSVQVDGNGVATVTWIPPDLADAYTLTGTRSPTTPTAPVTTTGRIVIQRSTVVIAADPSATKSTLAVSATSIAAGGTATVTIVVKDKFGNVVTTAAPTDFTLTATRGTFGAVTCTLGTCTVTYTAPATAGGDSISVKILGVEILLSPKALTIT